MNRKLLLLSSIMVRGYGVSLVADEWAKKLCSLGWDTTIACLRSDETYAGHNLIHVGADATEILALCKKLKVDLVMAQTSPYFEALPAIAMQYPTIAFEHGDPTPSFFKHDRQERENIKQNKIQHVYPNVSRVLASSHFLRHDIEWSTSSVVPLGCNHVDDFGPKTFSSTSHLLPLQIGTLMRLGEGESLYKGVEIFADIAKFFQEDPKFEFHIMGKKCKSKALLPCSCILPLSRNECVWDASLQLPNSPSAKTNQKALHMMQLIGLEALASEELRNGSLTVADVWSFFCQFQHHRLLNKKLLQEHHYL